VVFRTVGTVKSKLYLYPLLEGKRYTRFVEKYVTGRKKRFRLYKEYRGQDQYPSESSHVRKNVEIFGTMKARRLRFTIQVLEL